MNTKKYSNLPEHLFPAHQWISAAGEWDIVLENPEEYAKEAYKNAIENEQFDIAEADLLEVIEWFKNNDNKY